MQVGNNKIRLAVFASGSGTNAEAIMKRFSRHQHIEVVLIVTNRSEAGVIKRADSFDVETIYLPKSRFENETEILQILSEKGVDWIILAGWLLLIPPYLVLKFPGRIINVHPALLPKFGGKGMYGRHVHEAVKNANEMESGISIHFVNEKFDEGAIIEQFRVNLEHSDSAEEIERKVRELELSHYASVIEKVVLSRV